MQSFYDANFDHLQSSLISLPATAPRRGRALLSHRIEAFTRPPDDPFLATHTMFGEALLIAGVLRSHGFDVDVISHRRRQPVRGRGYDLFLSSRENFDPIAAGLGPDCIKIAHLDTMHWAVNNHASLGRSLEVQRSRGVTPEEHITITPNRAIETADCATVIGNAAVHAGYAFAGKPVFELPHPAMRTFAWPADKDFAACRTRFVWFGSRGLAHKGLGRVLEAFARMPEMHLTVCGPLDREPRFVEAYRRELHGTPNIHARGWIDITGPDFPTLAGSALGTVFPSCAEAQAGSVIHCMQAGLVPMVSRETGLDVDPSFGVLLEDASPEAIVAAVRGLARRPTAELAAMAHAAWALARARYTPERYVETLSAVIGRVLDRHPASEPAGFIPMSEVLGPARRARLVAAE